MFSVCFLFENAQSIRFQHFQKAVTSLHDLLFKVERISCVPLSLPAKKADGFLGLHCMHITCSVRNLALNLR